MYKVSIDRSHVMVCMTASGFFTLEALEAAAIELHEAIRSLGPLAGQHVTLYDYTDLKVVPGPVLDRFARYFSDASMQPLWARRVAFVSRSALLGLQLRRIQRENMALFDNRAAATAWLLDDQARLRATSQPTAASG